MAKKEGSKKAGAKAPAKRVARRKAIGSATVKRVLRKRANDTERVSSNAAKSARDAVSQFLKKLGEASQEGLALGKRKTVNMEILGYALKKNACHGVSESDLSAVRAKEKKGDRELSRAGAVSVFEEGLGKGARTSDGVKNALLNLANAYLASLAGRASLIAHNAGRNTIKDVDVKVALQLEGQL